MEIFETNITLPLNITTTANIEYVFDNGFFFYDPFCEVVGIEAECIMDTFTNTAKVTPSDALPLDEQITLLMKNVRMPNTSSEFHAVLINVMGQCT